MIGQNHQEIFLMHMVKFESLPVGPACINLTYRSITVKDYIDVENPEKRKH